MSKYIYSKYSQFRTNSSGFSYKVGDSPAPIGQTYPIPTTTKDDHLFLNINLNNFKHEKDIISNVFRMYVIYPRYLNENANFSMIKTEDFAASSLTSAQANNEINRNDALILGTSKINFLEESNVGYIEFDVTNYVIERIKTDKFNICFRIENDSQYQFQAIDPVNIYQDLSVYNIEGGMPLHSDGLITIIADPIKDAKENFSLGGDYNTLVNYLNGTFFHQLPTIGGVSLAISNTQNQVKSNLLSSLFFTYKKVALSFTLIDYIGNEMTYRTIEKEEAKLVYGFEDEDAETDFYLNINDFSYSNIIFGNYNNDSIKIKYLDETILTLNHVGQLDSFGNRVYRLESISKGEESLLNVDWSHSNQAIIEHKDEITIITFSDTKIDNIEIPKWHKRYNLSYEYVNNKYYLNEVKMYNQDELGDYEVSKLTFSYDGNKQLSLAKFGNITAQYNYQFGQLLSLNISEEEQIINSYQFAYFPLDKYTQITNQLGDINIIHYNDLEQKIMITDNKDYVTFESYKKDNGEYAIQRKEVFGDNLNDLPNSKYQIDHNESTHKLTGWQGFWGDYTGDDVITNSFFPNIVGDSIINYQGVPHTLRELKTTIVPTSRYQGDNWFFSAWVKADVGDLEILQLKITVHQTNGNEKTHFFDFDKRIKDWQIITGSIECETNYNTITYAINYKGKNYLSIGKLKLYKHQSKNRYHFNNLNQIEKVDFDSETVEFIYDKGKVVKATTPSGRTIEYLYNEQGDIESIKDSSTQFMIEHTYENNQLIKEVRTSVNGVVSEASYAYDNRGLVTQTTDEDGFIQNYLYDKYGRLIQVQDSSGIGYQKKYNMKNQITGSQYQLNDQIDGGIFEYDIRDYLYQLKTRNGTRYEFDVPFGSNKLRKVNIDGVPLESRTYGIGSLKDSLIGIKFGNKNEKQFEYDYDQEYRVTSVKYNDTVLSMITYDDIENNIEVSDEANNLTKKIYFDETDRFKKQVISMDDEVKAFIEYNYDDSGNLQKKLYSSNNLIKAYDFNQSHEFSKDDLNGYLNRISMQFLNDYLTANENPKTIYSNQNLLNLSHSVFSSDINQNMMRFDDVHSCIVMSTNQINYNREDKKKYGHLVYNKFNWINGFENNKIVYAWIKVSGVNQSNKEIIRMGNLCLYLDINLRVKLKYNSTEIATQVVINADQWTLVSLRLTQTTVSVTINNHHETFSSDYKSSQVDFISIGNYPIANPNQSYLDNKPFEQASLVMDVLYVGYGSSQVTSSDLKAMYLEGKRYLEHQQNLVKEQIYYYNAKVYEGAEVITLNGSTMSSHGRKPVTYQYTKPNHSIKKLKLFTYDYELSRYVYGSFSNQNNNASELTYKLDLSNKGTINLFIKPEEVSSSVTRTIFSLVDDNRNAVAYLFIDETFRIRYLLNGVNHATTHTLNPNVWQMISFMWESNKVTINVNNQIIYQQTVDAFDFSDTTLFVGSRCTAHEPIRHFEGYFEMVSIWNDVLNEQQLFSIYEDGAPINVESRYDSNGRLIEKSLFSHQATLTKTLAYQDKHYIEDNKPKIKLSKVPTSETNIDGTQFGYKYDEYLNIIQKECLKPNGEPTMVTYYTYDELKRLSSETNKSVVMDYTNPNEPNRIEYMLYKYTYQYDQNGNIIEKVKIDDTGIDYIDSYQYHGIIKDRLESISRNKNNQTTNIYELTYNKNYGFWPEKITKDNVEYTLSWQGSQLMSFGNYQYSYDDNGIRIKKSGNGVNVQYELDGANVICSSNLNINQEVNYHFDHNHQLIGLNYKGKEYFYQRNILGEIYGIIDSKGKVLVSYHYEAFGVPTITIGSNLNAHETTIAQELSILNIYLYKGYIYDYETKLYYCQTRYYDPKIGRWLSVDNINYLDSESVGGLNLYAYCGNNPIMYIDRNGTSPLKWYHWLAIAIGAALVLTGVGILIAGAAGAITTATLFGSIALGAAKGALIGAAIGTGVGAIGGGIYAGVTGADFWTSVGQGAALGFGIGAVIGTIIGGAHGSITYMRSTVIIDGHRVSVYRGGDSVALKTNEYKVLVDGTQRGLSVNANAAQVQNFGGAYRVSNVPKGLQIVQQGKNLSHFEIVAKTALTPEKMQILLNKIILIAI